MTVKRNREDTEVESLAIANCLMLLSRVGAPAPAESTSDRVFTCKTCSRAFPSFQALGGHSASHNKKPKIHAAHDLDLHVWSPGSPANPKTHDCSICGSEFAIGQALGGHMRRHKAEMGGETAAPVLLKKSSSKRIWGLDLNLALTI